VQQINQARLQDPDALSFLQRPNALQPLEEEDSDYEGSEDEGILTIVNTMTVTQ
jgi:hypothetical protein